MSTALAPSGQAKPTTEQLCPQVSSDGFYAVVGPQGALSETYAGYDSIPPAAQTGMVILLWNPGHCPDPRFVPSVLLGMGWGAAANGVLWRMLQLSLPGDPSASELHARILGELRTELGVSASTVG